MSKSRKELLDDLYSIGVIQGKFDEGWTNEFIREDVSTTYVLDLMELANEYGIEYDEDMENYREHNYDGIENLQDYMGNSIKEKIIKEIYDRLGE